MRHTISIRWQVRGYSASLQGPCSLQHNFSTLKTASKNCFSFLLLVVASLYESPPKPSFPPPSLESEPPGLVSLPDPRIPPPASS